MSYTLHPLCTIFPRMLGLDYERLCEDLKAHGLQEPIVLFNGQILDGGNRYRACQHVGIEPRFVNYEGDDPVNYVLSKNLRRRHLVPGQHAAIVAAAQNWAEAYTLGKNQHAGSGSATLQTLTSAADRAATAGVSVRTQSMADKVAKADPELVKKVAHGEVSLPQAVKEVEAKSPPKPRKAKPETTVATETASSVSAEDKAPGAVKTTEGDDDGLGDFDPYDELKRVMKELEEAHAIIKAAEADDLKAEAMKWRRAYDHAQREQSAAMDRAKEATDREAWTMRQLRRCGKAVGQEDPSKVAAAVEAMARAQKVAA